MTGRRRALLVGTETYQDPSIAQLRAPSRDVEALAEVLENPAIGGYEVSTLLDRPAHEVASQVEDLFADVERDDLCLLYFSGHGIKDLSGRLFLGMANTRRDRLRSTGLAVSLVNELMGECRSRRKVLILDCCYAGAVGRGLLARSDDGVGLGERFHDGHGHVVLTATDTTQYAFEGEHVSGAAEPSVFTQVLLHGLLSGEADLDRDGFVSVDDLYGYLYREVTSELATQRPQKWAFSVEGTLRLARNPRPQASPLPAHLSKLLGDGHPEIRRAAIHPLVELLAAPHPGLALGAREKLSALCEKDDSLQVRQAARAALEAANVPIVPSVPPAVTRREQPPAWAAKAGQDRFGRWTDVDLHGVQARLRWIAPGSFSMGSPESEEGRDDDEGPQHRVTLTKGFWLGETPVTQAQWEAVMGANPSYFVSPDRPVEQVSWDDAWAFFSKLNTAHNGLSLRMPTEAEWEYACRAGTTTSTYGGELKILGDNNGPVLDEIAWYGGNSGVNYDLERSVDSSGWDETQYPHTKAGTRLVKQKRPNEWGLYDMLGNVSEWCADWYGAYETGPLSDPSGVSEGSERVIRGGSWYHYARYVRAAFRVRLTPAGRDINLGFRLARGQG